MKALELKNLFDKVDKTNRNELLKWFALAYYDNEELITSDTYRYVYIYLSPLYKPLTEDKDGLKLLKDVKNKEVEQTQAIMSYIILEQLMIGVKGNIGVDKAVEKTLLNYHDKYNKEFISELYMKMLKEHLDEPVYVVGLYENKPILEKGDLQEVDEYQSVTVNDTKYNFIGYQHYIKNITSEDNKILYYNNKNYDMKDLITAEDIFTKKAKLFSKDNIKTNKSSVL